MDICTIIAKNYVAHARVLADSFRVHHPGARCWVLVIDEHDGFIDPAAEPFELVTIRDLDIDEFEQMAALYTVLELSTAVKPWLLRYLMEDRDLGRILYLDPDIRIFDPLDEVDGLLDEHAVVVTPHLTEPMPRDGKKPSETDILVAGSYNLGFIGLSWQQDTRQLLEWWSERLRRDCIVAPERGYFVDQRWIDFAPGLVPSFYALRDPGYNVAYWNLAGRKVSRAGDGYTVNGRPLRFFHFSGYDPRQPSRLSKHQTRIDLGRDAVVRELCDAYGAELRTRGFDEAIEWEYSYNRLANGLVLDDAVREVVRRADGAPVTNSIWAGDGAERFVSLLNEPADIGGEAGVTRYLHALRDTRDDLRAAFPNLAGADADRYVAWAQSYGGAEAGIPAELLPNDGAAAPEQPPALGVNVTGYFESVLGVGEVARQLVKALETQDVPVSTRALVARHSEQSEEFAARSTETPHPVNLVCVNADVFEDFAWDAGEGFFANRYTIGVWWWEVEKFPERWLRAFRHVDEVWVGSNHVAEAVAAVSPVPVMRIPIPVQRPAPAELGRPDLGLPDGFLFLFTFDFESVFARKNPLGVVEAFKRAFSPGSGAVLAIKSINHEHHPEEHAALREAVAEHPDIQLVDRYVSRPEKDALAAACDCYVSLHRSEGFGFTLAEAMALGKPVIATGYSGNRDYMDSSNSFLVDYELVEIGAGADPYPAEARWADPDLGHAAALMREVFEHPEEAAQRAARGRDDILTKHSYEVAGEVMAERLRRAVAQLKPVGSARAAPRRIADIERVSKRVVAGPDDAWSPGGRFSALRRRLRQLVYRVIKPYMVHQRSVDQEVLKAISILDEAVRGLGEQGQSLSRYAQELNSRNEHEQEALQARIDDLVSQVDELRAEAERSSRFVKSFGLSSDGISGPVPQLESLPQAPLEPWTHDYVDSHRDFVAGVLDDPRALMAFKTGIQLPDGYGVGFDERVIEFPWLFSRALYGRVLDAGSTLNHAHTLARIRPRLDELHIVTLAPEPEAYPFLHVSYLYGDLRELPIQDAQYDSIVSLSTLEHVGMDNEQYGGRAERVPDPDAAVAEAMRELRRVLKPTGVLHLTVPYGEAEDFGWLRIFDEAALRRLMDAFEEADGEVQYYVYEKTGWQLGTEAAARGRRYRDHFTSDGPAEDRAVAARAVACVTLRPR